MGYFRGKKIFITGGSAGIGLETALMLSSFGASVAIFGKDEERLIEAFKSVDSRKVCGKQAVYSLQMDVTDLEDVRKKIYKALKEFGVPDILINSAGVGHADYFENVTHDIFQHVININLFGARNVIAELLPFMKQKGGHIVNVSSMHGLIGFFGHAAYSASKFALVGFSESLRNELKQHNIHVSVYCPPKMDVPNHEYMLNVPPPETQALVRMTGVMSTPKAAWILLDGIEKKKFLIVAGIISKFAYATKRLYPTMSHLTLDLVAKFSRKRGMHRR
jgi:3-dehydrosphinganine reductase